MRAAKRLQLSSRITGTTRATLEPSIGASLILPKLWAEEASEISVVQAATFRGGVYRTHRVTAALHAVSYPAAAVLAALAGMAVLVAVRPWRWTAWAAAAAHHDRDDASGSANGGGSATASSTDRLWAGSSSGAPVAAPPTHALAPVAAASVAAFKPGAAPAPPPESPAGPVTAPKPSPPETAAALAPLAVTTAGGGVNAGAGFGAGLLAPFLEMPDTADERTLQLLDEEDEDGGGEGEG
ncbi:hypothetical protein PLESTB_000226000 [Pleodorina starrii]|uniref:Transmembrane protein n=1 Tax=Pleodorina starrii TaxID=330485 RepID=A0A9W6EYR2_9CHLO|nr:hypothetical protein PLESTB_000226000 [Pleodorina starrii]